MRFVRSLSTTATCRTPQPLYPQVVRPLNEVQKKALRKAERYSAPVFVHGLRKDISQALEVLQGLHRLDKNMNAFLGPRKTAVAEKDS